MFHQFLSQFNLKKAGRMSIKIYCQLQAGRFILRGVLFKKILALYG